MTEYAWSSDSPDISFVTLTVKLYVPAAVGTPDISVLRPVAAVFNTIPVGIVPLCKDQV